MENQSSSRQFVFIFRFFSGLRSVKNGIWNPQGVPAIYKLLEHAARQGKESTVLLFCKTPRESAEIRRVMEHRINALSAITFVIIPFYSLTGVLRIDALVTNFIHSIIAVWRVYKLRPSLVYCDRAHLGLGAIFAWGTHFKVVVRMLGVARLGELYERCRNAILHPIQYFAIRAPFSYVICSKDGSPVSYVLKAFLNKKVPHVMLLNGVDEISRADVDHILHDPVRILFVGRLDSDKGCLEFIEALRLMRERRTSVRFTVTMVGTGVLEGEVKSRLARYGLNGAVILAGHASHSETQRFYNNSDIYVSLNTLGNLSNTVLEALVAGICTIVLKGDRIVDNDTDELLPEDIVLRVDRMRIAEDLAVKIADLLNHPERIQECARRTKVLSNTILESWKSRIAREWTLLENICRN